MKSRKGIFALLGVALFSVCFMGMTAVSAAAQATGSISGRVTDEGGAGIGKIEVKAFDLNDSLKGSVLTDAAGDYTIAGLAAGTYKVLYSPNGLNYLYEYYSDKISFVMGDPVVVSAGQITPNIDAQLVTAGQISGRVTDESGAAIQNIKVVLYSRLDWAHPFDVELMETLTDAAGGYSFIGLARPQFAVKFEGNGLNYLSEWYNDKPSADEADPISAPLGGHTTGIDASLNAGGRITGRVTDSYGKGIEGIQVVVYSHISNPAGELAQVTETSTNATGDYTAVGMKTGQYIVGFFDPQYRYRFEYYNDNQNFPYCDEVAVTTGNATSNIDAQLAENVIIHLSQIVFRFEAMQGGAAPSDQSCAISNSGLGTLNWTATPSVDWFSVTPSNGVGDGVISVHINKTDLPFGNHLGLITVSDPGASNSPQGIYVDFQVLGAPPFGSFDGPVEGSVVCSSIPVTGWALDDIGVTSVKIYRGSGENDRIYIGDATFVEGARPDVEAAYPYYPQTDRAGWGYMLLTNFLPNGGNGVYQLLAYATDTEGHEVLLGSKTIICDNANAIKPFGAIDTPAQGGTASGGAYLNFGWALTPQPNMIPIDGSTLNVWVDGLPLGHPVYNNYRADIATLFPGYANSNGAVGVFTLDTTGYSNGVHTIEWSATDSGGNTDGIGSRYFSILNAAPNALPPAAAAPGQRADIQRTAVDKTDGSKAGRKSGLDPTGQPAEIGERASRTSSLRTASRNISELAVMSEDVRSPVYVKRGRDAGALAEIIPPEPDGMIRIAIPQVGRLAVYLNEGEAVESEAESMERAKRILSRTARLSIGADVLRNALGETSLDSKSMSRAREDFRDQKDSRAGMRSSVRYEAFQLVGCELRPLPIGSSFDPETGAFFWQPGPGFVGEYRFIFVDREGKNRKTLSVTIG